VYAVGLLLHEMIAGSQPFHGDTEMQTALSRLSVPPDPVPASTPAVVASIVARCLALDPDDRWPSAHVLAGALDAAMQGTTVDLTADATIPPRRAEPPRPQAPEPPRPRPQPARHGAAWPWAIVGAIVLGIGAGGGYLIVQELSKQDGGSGDVAVQIARADDFDPDGDNLAEHPEETHFAIDGNPATEWSTETYRSQDLGGKAGVGLIVVLSSTADISSLEVDTGDADWSAEIYIADSPADSLGGWGSPVASGDNLGTSATFDVGSRRAGAILIWITRVPESGRLDIVEVRVA
jgi:serine/threonine-protein kinase